MTLQDKKITFLGDSITFGVGVSEPAKRYSTLVAHALGAIEHNMGISGTTLCTDGHRYARLSHVRDIPTDSELVIVLLGTNDFDQCRNTREATYYTLGTAGSTDTSTVFGAMDAYCRELKSIFPKNDTKICFLTPVTSGWNSSVEDGVRDNFDREKRNAAGYTLGEMADSICSVARSHGFLAFDLYRAVELFADDFLDGLHPNDAGAQKMARAILAFLATV